jgi:hypothetical protein
VDAVSGALGWAWARASAAGSWASISVQVLAVVALF